MIHHFTEEQKEKIFNLSKHISESVTNSAIYTIPEVCSALALSMRMFMEQEKDTYLKAHIKEILQQMLFEAEWIVIAQNEVKD